MVSALMLHSKSGLFYLDYVVLKTKSKIVYIKWVMNYGIVRKFVKLLKMTVASTALDNP